MSIEDQDEGPHPLRLLVARRLGPLFAAQFLGAFNDNLFKTAIAVLVVYHLALENAEEIVALSGALFLLPFVLFSATGGALADRLDKARLLRWTKAAEIGVMALGAGALALESVPALLAVLFLIGTQATLFGPAKYAALPELLAPGELIAGNGLVEGGTFLAILAGTVLAGILIAGPGPATAGLLCIGLAVVGWLASLGIPRLRPAPTAGATDLNPWRASRTAVAAVFARRDIGRATMVSCWFWVVGVLTLGQLPAFVKLRLGGDETVLSVCLALFAIGVALGSIAAGRLAHAGAEARLAPLANLAVAAASLAVWAVAHGFGEAAGLRSLGDLAGEPASWALALALLALAAAGGLLVVPLHALIQRRAEPGHRARIVAGGNIISSALMAVASVLAGGLLALGLPVEDLFLLMAAACLPVGLYAARIDPARGLGPIGRAVLPLVRGIIRPLLRLVIRLAYGLEVSGLAHWRAARAEAHARGTGVLAVSNHLSYLDGPVLASLLEGNPAFAVNTVVAQRWWFRLVAWPFDIVMLEPADPHALRVLLAHLRAGRDCVIFPEGRITVTGGLMKVYDGTGLLALHSGAPVVPLRLDGLQHSGFGRLAKADRQPGARRVRLTAFAPRMLDADPGLSGRARRKAAGAALTRLMTETAFAAQPAPATLFEALLDARDADPLRIAVEDAQGVTLTRKRLVVAALALGRRLAAGTAPGERVGLLVPNAAGAVVGFFALQAIGRVPAMLNWSAGEAAILAAQQAATLRTVVASRRFVELGRLEPLVGAIEGSGARIVWLEDIRASIGTAARLRALAAARFARRSHAKLALTADSHAVVLFTSGSEGVPKGVVLSHANLIANGRQAASVFAFGASDKVFNPLPLFHAFGLTAGMLLPVLGGASTFLYPSPLHYRTIPEALYGVNATIMFATDTFLAGYARAADAYDFRSLRLVFAGAERVREETRRLWADRFGVRVMEGYGATEAAPVLALNTPLAARPGSVGRLVPGIEARLEPVPGLEEGARLLVRGPNVMLGYLRVERPGVLEQPDDGWHDTGDIVTIDADGFVTIRGRAKRFAKIAGEMVSLAAVEMLAEAVWPDARHAAIALPDPRKGERIVLVSDLPPAEAAGARAALQAAARQRGIPELTVPAAILVVDAVPLLPSGKTDLAAIRTIAEQGETAAAA